MGVAKKCGLEVKEGRGKEGEWFIWGDGKTQVWRTWRDEQENRQEIFDEI